MTLEPIKETKTLWDCFDPSPWFPLLELRILLEENKPRLKKQRSRKGIVLNVEVVEDVYAKAIDLNYDLWKKGNGTSKSLQRLRILHASARR